MLRTLPTTSHHIAICEGNFLRLFRLLDKFSQDKYAFETVNPNSSHLDIKFLEDDLNSIIYEIYNLDSNDINIIENYSYG